MKTMYDIGDKVTLVAVVKGIQMHVDDRCSLYMLKVPGASEYQYDVYLSETELDKMNGKKRASKEQENEPDRP